MKTQNQHWFASMKADLLIDSDYRGGFGGGLMAIGMNENMLWRVRSLFNSDVGRRLTRFLVVE